MLQYIIKRLLQAIPVLLIVSMLSFIIIDLPPGDYLTSKIMALRERGSPQAEGQIENLRKRYGLDKPLHTRYLHWMKKLVLEGDMGVSFTYNRPVSELIGERLALTMTISIVTIILTWAIALPLGIYSAVHQYSFLDYLFTAIAFIGMATPPFLLAIIVLYGVYNTTGVAITGLFSAEYMGQPWSIAKFLDMLKHMWVPALIIGATSTGGLIRVLRGCLLDELPKQYVTTARAKGLTERKLIFKYPVRIALNPLFSTIGWLLPAVICGETIVSIVLNLPTTGPMLLEALKQQDMYLAGSFIMLLSILTIIGTLISDILLAWSDPRIRYS